MTAWPFDGLERGKYGAIFADPPWHFRARTALKTRNWTSARDAEKHYPVMGADDIAALPVRDLAAPDCHLFLWTTGPCLRQAFDVIEAWGFRYSAIAFTWIKLRRSFDAMQLRVLPTLESDLHVGLGLTTRKNAEFVLLGRRGNCKRIAKDVREIIMAPVREHSRKPDEAYRRVERYCAGPYLELFARTRRPGWDAWGNEVGKFDSTGRASSGDVGPDTNVASGATPLPLPLTTAMQEALSKTPKDFDPHAPIENLSAHFDEANRVMRERLGK